MSDNAKITRPGLILALLLTAAAGSAAERPTASALTPERLSASFASLRFELRAELQAPPPALTPRAPLPVVAPVVTTPTAPRLAANF